MRAWALMNSEGMYGAYREVFHSVRTGEPAFERALGAPLFDFLAGEPEQGAIFNQAMGDFSRQATASAVDAYDLSSVRLIVDVGGGDGTLVATALERHRQLRGVVFDLPHVAALTGARIAELGLEDRCSVQAGDFFDSIPAGGDVYALSWILHDWDDERCVQILRNCRSAIADGGRLLIVETLLPPGDTPHWGKVLDVAMLVVTGGRERTEAEYSGMLERAGFELSAVHPTASLMSVIEALPA
jgi:hypothetical protein